MKSQFSLIRLMALPAMLTSMTGALVAHAAVGPAFNTMGADAEFLVGRNVTQNQPGFSDPVTANANEEVEVALYYHNTANGADTTDPLTVAKNTTIKVSIPSDVATSHKITGSISADNATAVTGTMVNGVETGAAGLTVTSNGPTSLAYEPGSFRWYAERTDQSGAGTGLAAGVAAEDMFTAKGLNIGDLKACFEHSGYIHFKVKLTGTTITTPTPLPPTIKVVKQVRKGSDAFSDSNTANPGANLEYHILVTNLDAGNVAKNIKVQDTMQAGLTYTGSTTLTRGDGTVTTLANGVVSNDGLVVLPELKPNETIVIDYSVTTATTIANNQCLVNTVVASSTNSTGSKTATAQTCFYTVVTPTPVPSVTPTATPVAPTPTPVLPRTGPEANLFLGSGMVTAGLSVARHMRAKLNLKKSARKIEIL
jgi:uncharacterized repeat protein (TIGR01451 family)